MNNLNQINSRRELNFPVELVYVAFANPDYLVQWWGPEGFSNTIHEFDLQPKGKWQLTMHGPDKGNYENSSVFEKVIPNKLVSWRRIAQPLFDVELIFERISNNTSSLTFIIEFETRKECDRMRTFIHPKNEEYFDRLERLLKKMQIGLG